jgi:hypothetical protein
MSNIIKKVSGDNGEFFESGETFCSVGIASGNVFRGYAGDGPLGSAPTVLNLNFYL